MLSVVNMVVAVGVVVVCECLGERLVVPLYKPLEIQLFRIVQAHSRGLLWR
jgi:hypothetical protein